jgi:hypothetical protein
MHTPHATVRARLQVECEEALLQHRQQQPSREELQRRQLLHGLGLGLRTRAGVRGPGRGRGWSGGGSASAPKPYSAAMRRATYATKSTTAPDDGAAARSRETKCATQRLISRPSRACALHTTRSKAAWSTSTGAWSLDGPAW